MVMTLRPRHAAKAMASGLLIGVVCLGNEALGMTWVVLQDGSGDAPTIQAAVDSCAAGDSVLVGEGLFQESVVVDTPIAIVGMTGAGGVTLSANGQRHCIATAGALELLVVESMTLVDASPAYGFAISGYAIAGSGELVVNQCAVSETGGYETRGVWWNGDATIQECEFSGLSLFNVPVLYSTGTSLTVDRCHFRDVYGTSVLASATTSEVNQSVFERVIGVPSVIAPFLGTTTIDQNVFIDVTGSGIGPFNPPVRSPTRYGSANVLVEQNTFVRVQDGAIAVDPLTTTISAFGRNIVTGGLVGVWGTSLENADAFVCNDVWGNGVNWDGIDMTGENGNISAAPLYCDPASGDFTLAGNSPCLPSNNQCGVLMGAFQQGCDPTAISPQSWGNIKALYR